MAIPSEAAHVFGADCGDEASGHVPYETSSHVATPELPIAVENTAILCVGDKEHDSEGSDTDLVMSDVQYVAPPKQVIIRAKHRRQFLDSVIQSVNFHFDD